MIKVLTPLAQFLATEGIEGFRLQTYDDKTGDRLDEGEVAEGKASIAVGLIKYSDGTPVEPGDELTLQEAWDETYHYLNRVLVPSLERILMVSLPDHKLMAFASWLYNFGETKARRYTLPKLINQEADDFTIIEKWLEYINAGGKPQLGLYRRRLAECLMWMDHDWRPALNADWDTSIFELIEAAGGEVPQPVADPELFEDGADMKPITDPTPETPLTTDDLNTMQLEQRKNPERPISLEKPKQIAITPVTPKVPLENYEYLSDEQKKDPKVKDVRDSQRGRAVGKKAVSKGTGAAGVGGAVALATGTAEPVLKVVDKYPKETLAWVAAALIITAVVYHFWYEWQLQKGRDEADSFLG